jgi:hypothetical protein
LIKPMGGGDWSSRVRHASSFISTASGAPPIALSLSAGLNRRDFFTKRMSIPRRLDGSQPDAWKYVVEVQDNSKPADVTFYR